MQELIFVEFLSTTPVSYIGGVYPKICLYSHLEASIRQSNG